MIFNIFKKKEDPFKKEMDELKTYIFQLPLNVAKKITDEILSDKNKFDIRKDEGKDFLKIGLDNTVLDFLYNYPCVTQVFGEASISQQNIGRSEYHKQYIRIATDSDFTELIVLNGSPEVYEVDGSEFDFKEPPFPSIYHWVIFSSCVVYSEVKDFVKD